MTQELSFLYTIDDIAKAVSWLIDHTDGRRVWLMTGDMGAGKTTLIKAVSQQLGAEGELSSPTYALVNEYALPAGKGKIYHLDLYRLRSLDEALDIGIEDYLLGGDYCFIEWPQLIIPLLREGEYASIHITPVSEYERKITILEGDFRQ